MKIPGWYLEEKNSEKIVKNFCKKNPQKSSKTSGDCLANQLAADEKLSIS